MLEEKLNKLPIEIKAMFLEIKELIYEVMPNLVECLWAGLPTYSTSKEKFVRIIPFKDHINIEALALDVYKTDLRDYKFTPKNMLQIYAGEIIPKDILYKVFKETLSI